MEFQQSHAILTATWETNIAASGSKDFAAESTNPGVDLPPQGGEVAITLAMLPAADSFDAYVDVDFLLSRDGDTWDTHPYHELNFNMDGSLATERRLTIPMNVSRCKKIKLGTITNNDTSVAIDEVQVYLTRIS